MGIATVVNYKDFPETLGSARTSESGNAQDWTPRDALIELLRSIDSGLVIDNLVVFYRVVKNGENYTTYLCATGGPYEQLGVVELGRMKMKRDMFK